MGQMPCLANLPATSENSLPEGGLMEMNGSMNWPPLDLLTGR
jgi:hypothetical protein